jgi:hypothetical protein
MGFEKPASTQPPTVALVDQQAQQPIDPAQVAQPFVIHGSTAGGRLLTMAEGTPMGPRSLRTGLHAAAERVGGIADRRRVWCTL